MNYLFENMAKFKNLITETGSFTFNRVRYSFVGIFETNDKELIEHFNSREDWCEVEIKSKKVEVEVKKPKAKKIKKPKIEASTIEEVMGEDSKAE